jgi:hypothetical protein
MAIVRRSSRALISGYPTTYHSGGIFREVGKDEVAQLDGEFDVDTAQIKVEAPVGHVPGAGDDGSHLCFRVPLLGIETVGRRAPLVVKKKGGGRGRKAGSCEEIVKGKRRLVLVGQADSGWRPSSQSTWVGQVRKNPPRKRCGRGGLTMKEKAAVCTATAPVSSPTTSKFICPASPEPTPQPVLSTVH